MALRRNIVASLDIGTTKTCAIIAERTGQGDLNILGFGVAPSKGMMLGTVANILQTAESIKQAVEIACNQAGIKVTSFNVGVAGIYINSMRYRNWVSISNSDHIVTEEDLNRLLKDVYMMRVPSDYFILHVIPEEYIADEIHKVKQPIGVPAYKLEAIYHIIFAQKTSTDNLQKAVEKAGFKINTLILQPLASANAVLTDEEKELGVAVIDIGGGTTDLVVYLNGTIRHSRVIGIAGNHVTNDIRAAFNIITEQSERLKIEYGFATTKSIVREQDVYVQTGGLRPPIRISISVLTEVINLRMRELFLLIDNELKNANLKDEIRAGIVLTGGGSLLKGCVDLAQDVLGKPARLGIPWNLNLGLSRKLENPIYSTAIGLLMNVIKDNVTGKEIKIETKEPFIEKLKRFFKEF